MVRSAGINCSQWLGESYGKAASGVQNAEEMPRRGETGVSGRDL